MPSNDSFLRRCLFCLAGIAIFANGANAANVVISVDGKEIKTLQSDSKPAALSLNHADFLPKAEHWNQVVIFFAGDKKTFLSDWQRRHSTTALELQHDTDAFSLEIVRPGGNKRVLPDTRQVAIFTDKYQPAQNLPTGPKLKITDSDRIIEFDVGDLYSRGGAKKEQQHGWPADWLLNRATARNVTSARLLCAGMPPLDLDAPELARTFIKLSRRNQWRAVVISDESNKRGWVRCKPLEAIFVGPEK